MYCYCTVNPPVREFVDPIGVVTKTVLAVRAALFAIAQLALTVVTVFPVMVQTTPVPEMVTPVAPVR